MMTGYLRLIVMNTLSNKRLSGYELIKQIEKDTGTWKPSFGSIYPLLERLLKENLVNFRTEGRKKVYFLTEKGKKNLKIINKSKDKLADSLMVAWNAFGKISDKRDKQFMHEILGSIRKGELPFKGLNPELSEFRANMFEAYSSGKDHKKIKSVIMEATRKLKSIK